MKVYGGIFSKKSNEKRGAFFSRANIDLPPGQWNEFHHPSLTVGIHNDSLGAATGMYFENAEVAICGDIALYNRAELINTLHIRQPGIPDIQVIAVAYGAWGRDCLKHINGDFSFTLWDFRQQSLFCARDPLGQRQLYYYNNEDHFVFSNRIQTLSSFSFARELDENWIIEHLQIYHHAKDRTIFKNIKSLLPAHYISVGHTNSHSVQYWELNEQPACKVNNINDALDGFRHHLETSVANRLAGYKHIGLELSGGIDSSVVAALAQEYLAGNGKGSATAFSNTLPAGTENMNDEWHKSSKVSRHLDIKEHVAVDHSVDDSMDELGKALAYLGQPTSVGISISHTNIYEMARRKKVDVLLSGFGGDQMVTANTKGIYTFSLVRERKIFELQKFLQKYTSGYIKSWIVTGITLYDYVLGMRDKRKGKNLEMNWAGLLLRNEWLGAEYKMHFFERPHRATYLSVKEKTALALHKSSVMQRLETGRQLTECYGFDYLYPLLDIPLIEFYHGLPDTWKADHQYGRAFIRRAMQKSLPPDIINQTKGGVGVPFLKIEEQKRLDQLKEWCLGLRADHDLFKYIDRKKLSEVAFDSRTYTSRMWHYISAAAMLALFLDKRKKVKFHHV